MMTIGVDIRVLGTGRVSGIEEYTEQLLAHMIPMGTDVQWKLFYAGRTPLVRRSWMDAPNVTVYDTKMSNRWLWLRTRLMGRPYLDELVGGADVFFFPHFLLGALSPKCKRVMTWHDLSYERMPELLSRRRRWWHAVQMRPKAQALASDCIIAVSRSTAEDLMQVYGVPAKKVSTIHSGIDPALRRASEPEIQQWRARRGIEGPFVLALGTREPRKNLSALVQACPVPLVIIGQRGWMEGEYGNTICIEDADQKERVIALSAASVLAYPSLFEGFGFPPLEAMACGTPVVVGATSSIIETVGDAGLLVDPYNVGGMTVALSAVLEDAGLRSRLVAKGYERASCFSWNTAAQSTLEQLRVVY
jgi:glycosyltransferase involved in cell wall biosynthesis